MARWLISRHTGAREWLRRQAVDAALVTHLDPSTLRAGDEVYGTLPVHLAAEVCERGARFFHLSIDVPATFRGQELTPSQMDAFGARLQEYRVAAVPGSGLR